MREHLPSLLIRASALLRHAGDFFRQFARFGEVGLVWIRTWPGISSRRVIEEREIKGCAKTPNRSECSTAKQEILPEGDKLMVPPSQREVPDSSSIGRNTGGRQKNENLIISIHVPKTGGTSFVDVLKACAEEVFYLDYGLGALAPTALFWRGKPITAPFESVIRCRDSFSGRSVIHGHFHAEKYVGRFPDAVYVTWLRDPVERVASNYFYWYREIPGDPLWEQVIARKMSLEQFAQLEITRNLQEALLSPLAVEQFDFIGITEEYDRSLELFRRLFCPDVCIDATVRNRNPNRQGEFYELDPELRKKILKLNERDAHIYLEGVRRFRYLCGQVGI
jgi:hypothetical protein